MRTHIPGCDRCLPTKAVSTHPQTIRSYCHSDAHSQPHILPVSGAAPDLLDSLHPDRKRALVFSPIINNWRTRSCAVL